MPEAGWDHLMVKDATKNDIVDNVKGSTENAKASRLPEIKRAVGSVLRDEDGDRKSPHDLDHEELYAALDEIDQKFKWSED